MKVSIFSSGGGLEFLYAVELLEADDSIEIDILYFPKRFAKKSTLGTLIWYVKKAGFYSLLFKLYSALTFKLMSLRLRKKARKFDSRINCLYFSGFNDDLYSCISRINPDLVVSINLYTIVPAKLLGSLHTRMINIHFGDLPRYRGMSPVLWAAANGELDFCSCFHLMTEGIDEGDILLKLHYSLNKNMSILEHLIQAHLESAKSLPSLLLRYSKHELLPVGQQGKPSYFGVIDRSAINNIRREGFKLFKLMDIFRY